MQDFHLYFAVNNINYHVIIESAKIALFQEISATEQCIPYDPRNDLSDKTVTRERLLEHALIELNRRRQDDASEYERRLNVLRRR